jgi:TRAP-type C4-dicarboxylate transport system substrate-binding protein
MTITRREFLGAASAAWTTTVLSKPAGAAAEFDLKLGVNTPDAHPLTVRLMEAARAIGAQSSDRLNVTVFPTASSAAIRRCCRRFAPAASNYWRRRA